MPDRIIANGVRTDHPIPGLPVVDDSVLDLTNSDAIEALGRHAGEGLWGRAEDHSSASQRRWRAFTTDPVHTDYAWVVRYVEGAGVSVVLTLDEDAAAEFEASDALWQAEGDVVPLMFRRGGYWWGGGDSWFRPYSISDPVALLSERVRTPGARSFTVAEYLGDRLNVLPDAEPLSIVDLFRVTVDRGPHYLAPREWEERALAAWANRRTEDDLPYERCVLDFVADEVGPHALVGAAEVAKTFGITQSTLRSYLSRGQFPDPQRRTPSLGWSDPVVDHELARRRRDAETVVAVSNSTAGVLGRISRDVATSKSEAPSLGQVTDALRGRVLGVAPGGAHVAHFHAGALLGDFVTSARRGDGAMSAYVKDIFAALTETDPLSAKEAARLFVASAVQVGHSRDEATAFLLDAFSASLAGHALVRAAVTAL